MKKQPISDATRTAILNATWSLFAEKGRLEASKADIARAAGVSRQSVYLAFGNRAGLLTAMARNKDMQSDHVQRLRQISQANTADEEDFFRYVNIWLDYLPLIYPVGILLDAESVTDTEAASAWDDRMKGALLAGLKRILGRLEAGGCLGGDWRADQVAELVWSLVHPTSWRQLVVGCGWSHEDFRRSRMVMIRSLIPARRD